MNRFPRVPGGSRARTTSCLLLASLALLSCGPQLRILSPADLSQAPASGELSIEIDLGAELGAGGSVTANLLRGIDGPGAGILSVPLVVSGTTATASLTAADLVPGRQTLFVRVDRDGDDQPDANASATFSWEPAVDAETADRCDPLDPVRCLFPFPSDQFTVADASFDSGRRVNFASASMPTRKDGVPTDPTEFNRNDGFSPGPKILTVIPDVDLAASGAPLITRIRDSLQPDSAVVLIDAETGERQLVWAELDPVAAGLVIVRVGKNLESGRRYIVAFRNLIDTAGSPIEAGRGFQLYRDGIPTFLDAFEDRRPRMEEIFTSLAAAGVPRDDLFLAWDFTVISKRNLSERMLEMRNDAFADLGDASPAFDVQLVEEAPNSDGRVARRISGSYTVPLYMTDGGVPGSRLRQGPDGLPTRDPVQDFVSPFRCILPNAASAENPSRLVLYGHGLLGSENEVNAANLRRFSEEHNITFCATKWHGMSEEDLTNVLTILVNLSLFPSLPDRMHQGFLSFLFLGRVMKSPDGFASHPAFQDAEGRALIDTSDLFYDGNSQGAIAGGALAAFAQDYTRAVLGVPGMNYSTLLRRSVDFDLFFDFLRINYNDPMEIPLQIALLQMLWDRGEVNGHANHITQNVYDAETPAKKILLHVAFGDHQVANVSAEVEARSLGARIHQPALAPGRHHDEQLPEDPDNEAYFGIEPLPDGPWPGSALIIWDSGTPTPPTGIVPPRPPEFGGDPHETPRCSPAARIQKSEFLTTDGAVIDVCNGAPCLAVDPPPCLPSP